MRTQSKNCKHAMRDLLVQDQLDAVGRSRLEVHLRRCESCRTVSEGLALIESGPMDLPSVSEDDTLTIYDRLIPSVHEIALDLKSTPKPWWTTKTAFAIGISSFTMIALALFMVPKFKSDASKQLMPSKVTQTAKLTEIINKGFLDRCEGQVLVDEKDASSISNTFIIRKNTNIKVQEGSRFNFRIGKDAKVALIGDTSWKISSSTSALLEMNLDQGRLAVEFDGSSGRMLNVRTPDSLIRVKGTIFTVEVDPEDSTKVSVANGTVEIIELLEEQEGIELNEGELIVVPGKEGIIELGDEQRALAAEIETLDDLLVATEGYLIRFDGNPERVNLEVDGRVLGHTPLTIRLPKGPISYRLTSPGMEPLESTLDNDQLSENIAFAMEPSVNYQPLKKISERRNCSGKSHGASSSTKNSNNGWSFVNRAQAAMAAGDIPYAIVLLEDTIKDLSDDQLTTGLSLLAECYASVGRYSEAADSFDQLAAMVPGTGIAQNSKYEVGRLAMDRLGDFSRARAAFTAYIASPREGELKEAAYFFLCELDGREGAHQNAIHCFNEFLRIFPGGFHEPNARLWRGALYQDVLKRWADAERDLKSFIKAKPQHPKNDEARYRIALGRYQTRDLRGASRMIKEYLREHPNGKYRVRAIRLNRAILDSNYSSDHSLK